MTQNAKGVCGSSFEMYKIPDGIDIVLAFVECDVLTGVVLDRYLELTEYSKTHLLNKRCYLKSFLFPGHYS